MPEDIIIATLREKNVPITNESYATLAYWRSYQKLSKEERLDVREAMRDSGDELGLTPPYTTLYRLDCEDAPNQSELATSTDEAAGGRE